MSLNMKKLNILWNCLFKLYKKKRWLRRWDENRWAPWCQWHLRACSVLSMQHHRAWFNDTACLFQCTHADISMKSKSRDIVNWWRNSGLTARQRVGQRRTVEGGVGDYLPIPPMHPVYVVQVVLAGQISECVKKKARAHLCL